MKASAEKTSSTTSATASKAASRPFFARAGGGDFFAPAARTAVPAVQLKLAVNRPGDKYEQEADKMADKVLRMPTPAVSLPEEKLRSQTEQRIQKAEKQEEKIRRKVDDKLLKAPGNEEKLQRKSNEGMPAVDAGLNSAIRNKTTGGQPLSSDVRGYMEPRFNADFSNVRVHSDPEAAGLSNQLSARAFAFQNHLFFSRDQYQPGTSSGKQLLAHELTHTIQQGHAVQRSPQTTSSVTQPHIQRSAAGEILDWFADKANYIPGFRMFTVVLGLNPINMNSVDRSAANILRALIEFMPGGALVTTALDNHGIFNKVAAWIDNQIKAFGMVGQMFKTALTQFIKDIGVLDLAPWNWGNLWNKAASIFTAPISRLISFAKGVITDILKMIKEAILKPLAALAQGTRGYDLLKAILGEDPITGEAVPRTAETLLGGFMKLIGQEEIWDNIKKGNAVARAWTWFQGALSGLMGFVRAIPRRIIDTITSLTIQDIVSVAGAFSKVVKSFVSIAVEFITWGLNTTWSLLEIIFDVVKPGIMVYIKKTGAALKSIIKNPLPFVGNLVRAAKTGFQNFADNFGAHLKAGLISWLTGSLTGVYIPKALSLPELGKFAMSVLGITWAQIRGKIVKVLGPSGETIMKGLETGFDIIVALVTGGPAAAWELIKEKLTELKDQVVSGIVSFVTETVIKKAIPKLISMFIPGAGFISAIISIYDTVMVFVEKISKIIQVVVAFIDSIVAIAAGNISAAAKRVESILGGLLSLAISFFAGFVGLGKVTDKIMGVIEKVRASVDKAIDTAINWIVTKAKALFAKLFGKKDQKDGLDPDVQKKLDAGLAAIDAAETPLKKDNKLAEEDAQKVASSIKSKHQVFKSISVVQMGDHWQYEYVVNPSGKKAGAKTGVKSFLGATRIGKSKTKFKGIFGDPAWNWNGYPTGATPHPANVFAGSSNSATVPKPGGAYMVAGAGTAGNISTNAWRTVIDNKKNIEKVKLQKQNPTWKAKQLENTAKAVVEQRYSMGWKDLYLLKWDQHHIKPINWNGDHNTSNMKYLRSHSEHSPLTAWWNSRKADIIAKI